MTILFNEKLDLLMNILKISNSALARHVSLDPSYISRLRNGHRQPSFEADYLQDMVKYFVKNCKDTYQKETINKLLSIRDLDDVSCRLYETLMYEWLIVKDDKEHIESFLDQVTDFQFRRRKPNQNKEGRVLDLSEAVLKNGTIYYGFQGKRKAVLIFLQKVLENPKPQKIYLLSEEKMDWLTEDPSFTKKWSLLLGQVVLQGNQVKIIHNINRSFDEMITAIKQWLPIYMTGAIEPYYYPKMRDRVFKKTLIIAEETIAITADTVGEFNKNQANILYTDQEMLKALTKEFNYYLELCRPLMKVYTQRNTAEYFQTLNEFESEQAPSILKSDGLSVLTLPKNVLEEMAIDQVKSIDLIKLHEQRAKHFKENLKENKFTEIIHLPSLEAVKNDEVPIVFSNLLNDGFQKYTLFTFKKHLENLLEIYKNNPNYNLLITQGKTVAKHVAYVKEEVGLLVAKASHPPVIFAINESNITSAFWDYLKDLIGQMDKKQQNREVVKDFLEKEIKEINKMIEAD
jgi:hypothetical protein